MDASTDPIAAFRDALERATGAEPTDATAATLATADAAGRPSARVVLIKEADRRGFVFFTNHDSRKAEDLAVNRRAALCFYWPTLHEQVRIEGAVERLSAAEEDAYFTTRPRGSQLGAWASDQSRPLASREELEARFREAEERYAGRPVPRPPFWGGYRLAAERLEFWYGRPDRLHDRFLFVRDREGWRFERLYP